MLQKVMHPMSKVKKPGAPLARKSEWPVDAQIRHTEHRIRRAYKVAIGALHTRAKVLGEKDGDRQKYDYGISLTKLSVKFEALVAELVGRSWTELEAAYWYRLF